VQIEYVKANKIKINPDNPRVIKDERFKKLVQSVREFPKMLEIRPIVVDANMMVLGGNMRLRACIEAGMKEIPVLRADTLTDEEQRRFIIADNVGFGDWDWEPLSNDWDSEQLIDWGVNVWDQPSGIYGDDGFGGKRPDFSLDDAIGSIKDNSVAECKCPKCGFQWAK